MWCGILELQPKFKWLKDRKVYVLINIAFPLKCQEHGLILISINFMSAAMTVLLGEADRHQSVRMGVGRNINKLLRRATKKARMPWSILGALGVPVGICT